MKIEREKSDSLSSKRDEECNNEEEQDHNDDKGKESKREDR